MNYVTAGLIFWGLLLLIIGLMRPKSFVFRGTMETCKVSGTMLTVLVLIILIGTSSFLMSVCPTWNGQLEVTETVDGKVSAKVKKNPEDEEPSNARVIKNKNQYELLADSILSGKLYIDYDDVDPRLLEMENPYDQQARKDQKVTYHWDHAFYNGRYYVYFGVVPVFLLFIPFKLITGASLATYHATQIFVGAAIIGLFLFFRLLSKKFFPKLPVAVYLLLASAVSLTSMVHCIAKPTLYMTAFSAGICMEVWSLYFFVKAVWVTEGENRALMFAFLGALFGALAFGCRPPIALGNIMVIPCLVHFIRKYGFNGKMLLKLIAAASPYIVIGILLMLYNYVRFDSPFEFGQKYQLTVADQTAYGDASLKMNFYYAVNGLIYLLFRSRSLAWDFPFVSDGGVFFTYPVFGAGLFALTSKKVRERLRANGLRLFIFFGFVTVFAIAMIDVLWTPYFLARYKEDIMWLMCIMTFVLVGMKYAEAEPAAEKAEVTPAAEGVEVTPAAEEVEVTPAAAAAVQPAGTEDTREFSSAVALLSVFAILTFVAVYVSLAYEYFTEEQMEMVFDAFMNIRFGIPLPLIKAQ